jgi:hypothetical protein
MLGFFSRAEWPPGVTLRHQCSLQTNPHVPALLPRPTHSRRIPNIHPGPLLRGWITSRDAFGLHAGPGLAVLHLSSARRASARKIIKFRLVSLVAVFLLRDFKTERPRLDQSTIWLFVRSKRPIDASGFACHVISPLLCAEHHKEIAPGRARVKGFRFQTKAPPLFFILGVQVFDRVSPRLRARRSPWR